MTKHHDAPSVPFTPSHADDKSVWARYWTHWYNRHLQEANEAKELAIKFGASIPSDMGRIRDAALEEAAMFVAITEAAMFVAKRIGTEDCITFDTERARIVRGISALKNAAPQEKSRPASVEQTSTPAESAPVGTTPNRIDHLAPECRKQCQIGEPECAFRSGECALAEKRHFERKER